MSTAVTTARPTQALRLRRESQRPNLARSANSKANNPENGAKEDTKRYVTTAQDILAKFKGVQPSLRVYLHANHFRINDSQESVSYASPMKELLEHIRARTVPHNMIEEFYSVGIPFYDSKLHPSSCARSADSSAQIA
jgi:transcription factor SPT20